MKTVNFSDFDVDKSKIVPAGTLSHLIYAGMMSIRDSKNYPKSIVKYLSEVSEGAMISFQNGTKVRKNVCCIWI